MTATPAIGTTAAAGATSDNPEAPGATPAAPVVRARRLALHGPRGRVYGPVDLDVAAGELVLVQGAQGSGRTSLLLTLAGRMVPDADARLDVLGHRLPRERRAVQRTAAIAGFGGIDDLDQSVTVGALVRERLAWLGPWYRRQPRPTQHALDEALAPAFGDRPVPSPRTVAWDLDELDAMLLRVALALLQQPRLLVVDDVDQVLDDARRQVVWTRLEQLAAGGLTVVAACASADEVARTRWVTPPTVVALPL
ncbi:AAA family ATPase [Cellulomonas fimi]|uniref:ATP-binding cassette domain-containing protein n=1 Tax=Cellulomonas fimi TaxID=1708 RepID=UPI00234E1045|nr:ATP-binding cassette domain-containing protein [Cellulomonas fimi]MDC7122330.1 AAA family ATPase [Cellulomonas fimi]